MYLICGEALYDVFVGATGTNERQVDMFAKAGGSPHNVAVGLSRLGCDVALATEIAGDALGRRLEHQLEMEGVDRRFLRRSAPATPLALVDFDEAGTAHYGFHGLDKLLCHPNPSEVRRHWGSIFGVHVGSIPIVSRVSAAPLLELIAGTPDKVLVSFDPNVRLSFEPDVSRWRRAVEEFRRHAHLIKVGEEDLRHLFGPDAEVDSIASGWLEHRCSLVAVTRGARGATLFSGVHGRVEIDPEPVVLADAVGAGDCFQAAMLAWLAEHHRATPQALSRLAAGELSDLGRFAARAAAITCRYRGPEFPYRKALD